MTAFEALIESARAAVDDRHLTRVRAWKEKNPGALAIGHMPVYAPRPLLEALGCLPVAVFGGGDQIDVIRGDAYFQSYICHIPRSTLELALCGDLAPLDGMIFPAICDVIRNLGGMWQLLFADKWSGYLDLPQNFERSLGGAFYAGELRRFARELHARGAKPLTDEGLRRAIADENARRLAIMALDRLRHDEPWRLRASEAYLAVRAGAAMTAREHTEFLGAVIDAARVRPVRKLDNVRVVMVGSFCEQPPLDLIVALERAGCDIVADDLQLGMRMIEGTIDGDSVEGLANAYLEKGVPNASRYIGDLIKGRALIERVRAHRAEGVVFAAASFCDPALLDQPMLEKALTTAGIAFTTLKYSENTGQFQTIREQAGAFSDSVKLWGGAA